LTNLINSSNTTNVLLQTYRNKSRPNYSIFADLLFKINKKSPKVANNSNNFNKTKKLNLLAILLSSINSGSAFKDVSQKNKTKKPPIYGKYEKNNSFESISPIKIDSGEKENRSTKYRHKNKSSTITQENLNNNTNNLTNNSFVNRIINGNHKGYKDYLDYNSPDFNYELNNDIHNYENYILKPNEKIDSNEIYEPTQAMNIIHNTFYNGLPYFEASTNNAFTVTTPLNERDHSYTDALNNVNVYDDESRTSGSLNSDDSSRLVNSENLSRPSTSAVITSTATIATITVLPDDINNNETIEGNFYFNTNSPSPITQSNSNYSINHQYTAKIVYSSLPITTRSVQTASIEYMQSNNENANNSRSSSEIESDGSKFFNNFDDILFNYNYSESDRYSDTSKIHNLANITVWSFNSTNNMSLSIPDTQTVSSQTENYLNINITTAKEITNTTSTYSSSSAWPSTTSTLRTSPVPTTTIISAVSNSTKSIPYPGKFLFYLNF
jgi:hypothetical protein